MNSRPGPAVVQVLAAALLFGTTGTAQALGPTGTSPLGVGAVRLLVGGSILLLALPLLGGRLVRAAVMWRTSVGLTAGICTALYQVCFFAAVLQSGVALGTLVTIGSGPIFAGLLALAVLREVPTRTWITATGLCVVGLGLLTASGATQPAGASGLVLALAAGAAYAVYTVASKHMIGRGEASATVMGSAFGLGGILLLPVLLTEPLAWLTQPSGIALAAYLGIFATGLAYALFGRGLAVLPAGPVTTLMLAEPVVASLLGVTILEEPITPIGLAGAALVVAGLILQGAAAARRTSKEGAHG